MAGFDFTSGESDDGRRILIYFLLDISGSMQGAPIQSVQDGLDFMVRELKLTPEAVEIAHLAVITFGSTAQVIAPLTPLGKFVAPRLTVSGSTNLTQALELVYTEIDNNFRENKSGTVHGDYKPLIFLMTDGAPDNISSAIKAAERLRNRPTGRSIGTFLALGCGAGAKEEANLRKIAPAVALMYDMTSENIRAFFQWVSASISTASRAASRSVSEDNAVEVAPPPKNSAGQSAFVFTF